MVGMHRPLYIVDAKNITLWREFGKKVRLQPFHMETELILGIDGELSLTGGPVAW